MSRKKWDVVSKYISYIILGVFLGFTLMHADRDVNTVINIAFLAIAFGFLYYNDRHVLRPAFLMKRDFIQVTQELTEKTGEKEAVWNELSTREDLFRVGLLNDEFSNYQSEMSCLRGENGATSYKCDIADYISEDSIHYNMNKRFSDQMPGIFTGLGILGTFIGLTLGLNKFNIVDTNAVEGSIELLMNGIKAAFYTSIFGVTFSIIYNMVINYVNKETLRAYDEFIQTFYEKVVPQADNDSMNQILTHQANQEEFMERLSDKIVQGITDGMSKLVTPVITTMEAQKKSYEEDMCDMTNELARRMDQSIASLGKTQEMQMTKLASIIGEFSERASENQKDSIKKIVDKFITEMNHALKGNFEQLGETVNALNQWQQSLMEKVDIYIDKVKDSTENVERVNEKTVEIVTFFTDFGSEMSKIQRQCTKLTTELEKKINAIGDDVQLRAKSVEKEMDTRMTKMSQSLEIKLGNLEQERSKHNALMEKAVANEHEIVESSKLIMTSIHENQDQTKEMLNQVGFIFKDQKAYQESFHQVSEEVIHATEQLVKASTDLTGSFQAEANKNLVMSSQSAQEFSKSIGQMDRVMKELPARFNRISEQYEVVMKKFSKDMNEYMSGCMRDYSNYMREYDKHMSALRRENSANTDTNISEQRNGDTRSLNQENADLSSVMPESDRSSSEAERKTAVPGWHQAEQEAAAAKDE